LKFKKNFAVVCRYRIHGRNMSVGSLIDRSFESLIIRRLLAQHGLRRIYHWLDWSQADAAEAAARYLAAQALAKIGDYHHSSELLEKIPRRLWAFEVAETGLRNLLFRGQGPRGLDLIGSLEGENGLTPEQLATLRQTAADYIQRVAEFQSALERSHAQSLGSCLKVIDDRRWPLPPAAASALGSWLMSRSPKASAASANGFNLLKRAVMTAPQDEALFEEICRRLPGGFDGAEIRATRNRTLSMEG
jgi:TPR repeat protein